MSVKTPKDVVINPHFVQPGVPSMDADYKKMIGVASGGPKLGSTGKPKGAIPKANTGKTGTGTAGKENHRR